MAQPGRIRPLPKDARRIPVPAAALEQWLAEIDDPAELKVTLRVIALLAAEPARRGLPPSLSLDALLDDRTLRRAAGLGNDDAIRGALAKALRRETLVAVRLAGDIRLLGNDERVQEYLVKTGLAPLSASDIGGADVTEATGSEFVKPAKGSASRANIFSLYEQHIGTFGHGAAEQLKAAEEEYPASWIEEAFEIANNQNVRSWGYVHGILRRWLAEGRPAKLTTLSKRQRDQRYDDGKLGHDTAPDRGTEHLDSYRRRHGRLPWESEDESNGISG